MYHVTQEIDWSVHVLHETCERARVIRALIMMMTYRRKISLVETAFKAMMPGINKRYEISSEYSILDCMKQTDLDRYIGIVNEKWRVSRGGKSARELIEESGILK